MKTVAQPELTDEVIAQWKVHLEQSQADAAWQASAQRERQFRAEVGPQMVDLLRRYLSRSVSLREFQSTVDRKSRTEWDILGIKGTSGAMFLNKLVKNVPNQEMVDIWLREALPVPADAESGNVQMRRLYDALAGLVNSKQIESKSIQVARTPFLLSAFWHLQDRETWPVFYVSARNLFGREGLYREVPGSGPVENYFSFRQIWLSLSSRLNLDTFDLEHLILWMNRHGQPPTPPPVHPPIELTHFLEPETAIETGSTHARAQWLLARIGRDLGYKVWIARNDRSKTWNRQTLGELSVGTLPPLGAGGATQRTVELIDVLWISGYNQIVAAFEVEHSTAIYSGLLRMSDLAVLAPLVSFPMYIVAPQERLDEVRQQLRRPTFQQLELHKRAAFFSIEALDRDAENIMKFANTASAIDVLAERVGDVSDDEGWQ